MQNVWTHQLGPNVVAFDAMLTVGWRINHGPFWCLSEISGKQEISPQFERHIRDASNWTLDLARKAEFQWLVEEGVKFEQRPPTTSPSGFLYS